MSGNAILRIGSRASPLARWQSQWVAQQLHDRGVATEIVWITTTGDVTTGPVGAADSQGLFTKEIQLALLETRIDLAVHSLKDLPTESVLGLELAAIPPREECGDALISHRGDSIDALPQGARVGTGSARRSAQLHHWRPDLNVADLRGNVDTRLRKLDDGLYDAIILAQAGLIRLNLSDRISSILPRSRFLPAVGQGALGLEIRTDDAFARRSLSYLEDLRTRACVTAERAMLAALRGGCLAPVGAWGRFEGEQLRLDGVVLSLDGSQKLSAHASAHIQTVDLLAAADTVGRAVAHDLLEQGAAQLIAESRIPLPPRPG